MGVRRAQPPLASRSGFGSSGRNAQRVDITSAKCHYNIQCGSQTLIHGNKTHLRLTDPLSQSRDSLQDVGNLDSAEGRPDAGLLDKVCRYNSDEEL